MNRRAFVIPTKGRPKCIEYILNTRGMDLTLAGFDIILSDSSTNEETKSIALRYMNSGLRVLYSRYREKSGAKDIDEKGFLICSDICRRYEYIWLCSDGTVIDTARVISAIEDDMERGKDLIVISDANVLPYSDKEFNNAESLCRELCWRMTLLGSVVVSGPLLSEAVEKAPYLHKDHGTLWLPTAYFKVLSQRPFSATYHCIENAFCSNPYKKGSFWYLSGNVLRQWGKVWCDSIDSLPACFDTVKNDVLLSHDRYMKVFSAENLGRLKASGNLTRTKVMRYRKYIKRVTDTPFEAFLEAAFSGAEMRLLKLLISMREKYFARND